VDFIIELLVQLVIQIVFEVIIEGLCELAFKGAARVLRNKVAQAAVGALAGLGIGAAWGHHLSGSPAWPKLLWVSLMLAFAAVMLALVRAGRPAPAARHQTALLRDLLVAPWQWPGERLLGFALINLGLAAGIVLTFRSMNL
jgi:hypothetical protein